MGIVVAIVGIDGAIAQPEPLLVLRYLGIVWAGYFMGIWFCELVP